MRHKLKILAGSYLVPRALVTLVLPFRRIRVTRALGTRLGGLWIAGLGMNLSWLEQHVFSWICYYTKR